jgi:hypothetical protein
VLGLVVERDVATDDRDPQPETRIRQTEHGAIQLPRDARLLRVAEVEAVGQAERLSPHAGKVLRALQHRLHRTCIWVAGDPAPVAVDGDGDRSTGLRHEQHGGVRRLGAADGPRADDRVVLLERPALRGDVRRRKQRAENR